MTVNYGKELREKEYMLTDGIFLNHGSYGLVPRKVFEKQIQLRQEMESHPDSWFRRTNIIHYRESLEVLCKLLNTKYENTVFVENVTNGTVSVLQSLDWSSDDTILITNLTFNAVVVMAKDLQRKYGTTIESVNIKFPIESENDIIQSYKEVLEKHKNIKLAVIDHITSPSTIIMPVKKLVDLCHDYGVMVFVDGAHTLGHVHMNIPSYNADFYSGNMHKWMFTPRGSGYLWVHPKNTDKIRPAVVSHFHGVKLHYDFCVRGTRDDTAYYTIQSAADFCEEIGGLDSIIKYSSNMLDTAIKDIEVSWNTTRFQLPESMTSPFLRLIKLPEMKNYAKTPAGGKALEDDLFTRFNIQVLCAHLPDGENYMRISGHVYNCPEDYVKLRDAVLTLMSEPEKMENKPRYQLALMHWELKPLDS